MIEVTFSAGSPFVRKVRLMVAIKGLASEVRFLDQDSDATRNQALRDDNPLGKVPCARLPDGSVLIDSPVICEMIDTLTSSPRLIPDHGTERWRTLGLAALADGIMDASIAVVYEKRFRPEPKWHQEWIDKQQVKIDAALRHLETKFRSGHSIPTTATSRSPARWATSTSGRRAAGAGRSRNSRPGWAASRRQSPTSRRRRRRKAEAYRNDRRVKSACPKGEPR